jgi:hypothetical protein
MKKLTKGPAITSTKAPCDWQVNKKKAHVFISIIFKLFLLKINSKKLIQHRWVFWKIWCLWLGGSCPWKLLSPCSFKGCCISYVHTFFPHWGKLLLKMFYLAW